MSTEVEKCTLLSGRYPRIYSTSPRKVGHHLDNDRLSSIEGRDTDSSSTTSSTKLGRGGIPGASGNPPGACDTKRNDLLAGGFVEVGRDRTLLDSTEAFFSESMRRDDMSGMRTVVALKMKDNISDRNTSSASRSSKAYIPGDSASDF